MLHFQRITVENSLTDKPFMVLDPTIQKLLRTEWFSMGLQYMQEAYCNVISYMRKFSCIRIYKGTKEMQM